MVYTGFMLMPPCLLFCSSNNAAQNHCRPLIRAATWVDYSHYFGFNYNFLRDTFLKKKIPSKKYKSKSRTSPLIVTHSVLPPAFIVFIHLPPSRYLVHLFSSFLSFLLILILGGTEV
jgi:hypothetical protein